MSPDFSAGPQALGYLYQARYALYLILDSIEETELSLEQFDDVSFQEDGNPTELIQLKHHISKKASLTDYSEDLWKTIRVWSSKLHEKKILPPLPQLMLITTGTASNDSIASLLRPDGNRDPKLACEKLVEAAEKSTNDKLSSAFNSFLNLPLPQQQILVEAINILDLSPNISDTALKIRKRIEFAVHRDHIDGLFERLEGWWFDKVIRHLTGGSDEPIARFEVHDKITEIAEQFRPDALPIDFFDRQPPSPPDPEGDERVFVLQLKEIQINYKRIEKAILDYYRAFEQRSRWVRQELLVGDEIERYEKKLIDEWERIYFALKDDLALKDESEEKMKALGREIYKWVDQVADIPIRPRVSELYVMRGSYQILADKIPPRVWWHPNFLERLDKLLNIPSGGSKNVALGKTSRGGGKSS